MRRAGLYSSSQRPPAIPQAPLPTAVAAPAADSKMRVMRARWRAFCERHLLLLSITASALIAALLIAGNAVLTPAPREIAQQDIDDAVLHTLETTVTPSPAAKAYEVIRGSVVGVRGYSDHPVVEAKGGAPGKAPGKMADKAPDKTPGKAAGKTPGKADDNDKSIVQGIGTGVVIVDKGIILTNLHVVQGFDRITVTFADGLESAATVIKVVPEHDLAVLQAATIPDDLQAATLRSTGDLAPGDRVIAVGFPFGIGPSVSSGVVSGLKREFLSPEGKRVLTNLIQFDAAANPGNSGGPLVTADGSVVGIVTGILNPTQQRVFVGIGFAVPIENAAAAVGIPPF